MPSQPTDVATTGRPTSSASMIFSRVPPPARNGATTTLDRARNGAHVGHRPGDLDVLVGEGAHGRRRILAHEEQPGLGNAGQDLGPDLAAQPDGGIHVGGPSHGGHERHGGIGCVRQDR